MDNKLQFEKVYKCPKCHGIGGGNRMVDHILLDNCTGKLTRKLREAERDAKYVGREAEAIANTEQLYKDEALRLLKVSYREMIWAIEHDIIQMKKLNEEFLPRAYQEYFAKVF